MEKQLMIHPQSLTAGTCKIEWFHMVRFIFRISRSGSECWNSQGVKQTILHSQKLTWKLKISRLNEKHHLSKPLFLGSMLVFSSDAWWLAWRSQHVWSKRHSLSNLRQSDKTVNTVATTPDDIIRTPILESRFDRIFSGCFNAPLEHTPKPLPTGHKEIPFIVGYGDCLGCALGVCCIFLGDLFW